MTGKRKISTLLRPSCTIHQSIEKGCVHTKSVTALPSHFQETPCGTAAVVFHRRLVQHLKLSPAQPTAANHISQQSDTNTTQ